MGIQTTKAEEGLRSQLTSDFRLPTSVAIKGGGRPTRLLPYAKMLLVSITFFSFCWVDCAIEGSTFFTEQMRF